MKILQGLITEQEFNNLKLELNEDPTKFSVQEVKETEFVLNSPKEKRKIEIISSRELELELTFQENEDHETKRQKSTFHNRRNLSKSKIYKEI